MKNINEIPNQYQHFIETLIKNGIIKTNSSGEFHLSDDMFELLLIMARAGLLP